jgi:mannitol-1-phosphate 5-dehydrogenase
MPAECFVGFGFGPIQAGVFAARAVQSGAFDRVVVAEVDPDLVQGFRDAQGFYTLNIAGRDRRWPATLGPIELLNPRDPRDAETLRLCLRTASDVALAVPSVRRLSGGIPDHPLAWLASDTRVGDRPVRVYVADNSPGAATYVADELHRWSKTFGTHRRFDVRATVIGKMSLAVTGTAAIAERALARLSPGLERAFVVEEHDRILCSAGLGGPNPLGLELQADLVPFQKLKLYAHNGVHAILGFLGCLAGVERMAELADDPEWSELAHAVWLEELGPAFRRAFPTATDRWFMPQGYSEYVHDLWTRMVSKSLDDRVERVLRDPVRKLGPAERVFGAMMFCHRWGLRPRRRSMGALAGLTVICGPGWRSRIRTGWTEADLVEALNSLWGATADLEQLTICRRWLADVRPSLGAYLERHSVPHD